jgi:hypothetical protein
MLVAGLVFELVLAVCARAFFPHEIAGAQWDERTAEQAIFNEQLWHIGGLSLVALGVFLLATCRSGGRRSQPGQ